MNEINTNKPLKLVIAGGGTGGHIFAGVAIAQEFLKLNFKNEVIFVGSHIGLETKLVPKSGFKLKTIRVGKIVGLNFFEKLKTLIQIPIAIIDCLFFLVKFKPNFIIGVGGFASGPCLVAAKILNIPIGVLEQNSVLGFTNTLTTKIANFVFGAFPNCPKNVNPQKFIFTGNPIRQEITQFQKRKNLNEKPFTIFIFGGSQGAHAINLIMIKTAKIFAEKNLEIKIIHQTGEKDFKMVQEAYSHLKLQTEVHPFIYEMNKIYEISDLVICRAGSSTITELAATEMPAILIPLPTAAQNHQYFNAKTLFDANACLLLEQSSDLDNTSKKLAQMIEEIILNPQKLEELKINIKKFFQKDSANKIISTMLSTL
jgi:UDP-N-acetylglucosamine--N-acetylmuramyl-(pentapeptide) pyrophosphoryl-undecaprenol N-acetylglucosamine transferase